MIEGTIKRCYGDRVELAEDGAAVKFAAAQNCVIRARFLDRQRPAVYMRGVDTAANQLILAQPWTAPSWTTGDTVYFDETEM